MSLFPEDAPYRVLARKYRPAGFDALIGQDAVVTTLGNAIARNRLAQAWLLTGVRGVGKTSTARIIAKALNCIGPDGNGGPTINPCGVCANCVAISAGQHMDVIEMDAASNTGVDNIREIIEAVRYASVSARYKVYIVDEVHMLSKGAFNALLKTLEEPPPHVKFIFATTEVQKVPATILSRCQRFDLKRVPADLLASHFAKVTAAEGAEAEDEALRLIARAAEGSVRDGLSILDQAIAQAGDGRVTAAAVRDMLGLADRGRMTGLLGAILEGDAGAALAALESAHSAGAEPQALIAGLLDMVHGITRAKMSGMADPALSDSDRAALIGWAQRLSFPALHRLWQLLLKGHADVRDAPVPQQAAEMAVLRAIHAADLPDPGELLKLLGEGGAGLNPAAADSPAGSSAGPARAAKTPDPAPAGKAPANIAATQAPATQIPAQAEEQPAARDAGPDVFVRDVFGPDAAASRQEAAGAPMDAASLVSLFADQREPFLAKQLHDDVAIVAIRPGALRLGRIGTLPADFAAQLRGCLSAWTGQPWEVELHPAQAGEESLLQIERRQREGIRAAALEDPMVKALLAAFPDAELEEVRLPDGLTAGKTKRSAIA
ncbi:DNA polymerase III subunit gamma/tau [Sandaracinobacteroides sp. A072]|uniref:DNA polymerase III subunit gamma/tau n=1 Tax=Sandaracinobacteroides sp. A072 TaxID=3461146 RepID=UPI00404222F9